MRAKDKMRKAEILELRSGSVSGIPALLLNEGARRNFDAIVLLGKILKARQNSDLLLQFQRQS